VQGKELKEQIREKNIWMKIASYFRHAECLGYFKMWIR
jgi:hypothetical protein